MNASDVPTALTLLQQRAQLQSRLSQVASATTLSDVVKLLEGTIQPTNALAQAKTQVSDYLTNAIGTIEATLTGLGVTL